MTCSTLTITSRKYDGTFRFTTEVAVLHRSPTVVLGLGAPGRVVRRAEGERVRHDWSLEYLPLDKPYNIVGFYDADGALLYHFCNALVPPDLDGGRMEYIDLDLDVVVRPDGSHSVEDRDQFEVNRERMVYPAEVASLALGAVAELEALAASQGHVFGCSRLDEARARLLELYGR